MYINHRSHPNGTPKTATYTVTPPGGTWDIGDNGDYTIALAGNEVLDDLANAAAANPALDTFEVRAGSGAATRFTDKTAWTTGIGGLGEIAFTEDFEGFASQEDWSAAAVVSPPGAGGNFSLTAPGGAADAFGNFVDIDAGTQLGDVTGVAVKYAAMFVDQDDGLSVEMTFDNPMRGWIGEFFGVEDNEEIEIDLVDESDTVVDILDIQLASDGFFGFTTTADVKKLVFRGLGDLSSGGEAFGLDNICAFEGPPTVSIVATDADAAEGGGDTATFQISRDSSTGALTVNLSVNGASTAQSSDYSLSPELSVSFSDGESSKDVTLSAVDDSLAEPAETVQLDLATDSAYDIDGGNSSATAAIAANDFGVTNTDDAGEGSLRQAIENANALGGNPTIELSALSGTITLQSQLEVTDDLTIQGPGADQLTISGDKNGSGVADAGDVRVLNVSSGAIAGISGLAIKGGFGPDGGGIFNDGGALTISDSAISGNSAGSGQGGGIFNDAGTLTISNSTISGNSATSNGGGIFNDSVGVLNLFNSTFSGNAATSNGGGIFNDGGDVKIVNSTVSGDSATTGVGGGIDNSSGGALTIANSIVAGQLSGGDVVGTISSGINNIIGVPVGLSIDDVLNTTLADNGGPTLTHALVPGSPALDAGDNAQAVDGSGNPLNADQRGAGFDRIVNGTVDIGAIEAPLPQISLSVSDNTIAEPGGSTTVTATSDIPAFLDVTVHLAFSGTANLNDDYQTVATSIVILAGQISGDLALSSVDDDLIESDETAVLDIDLVDNGAENGAQQVSVTIQSEDAAGFVITESGGGTAVDEGGGADVFEVVLTAEPVADVVIDIASNDTGEVNVNPGSLTFTSANWDTPQEVETTGVDDPIVDGDQSVNVELTVNAGLSDDDFDSLSAQTVAVLNSDDDVPTLTLTIVEAGISENGGSSGATVSRNTDNTSDLTVDLSSDDTSEATVPSTVTILAGDNSATFTVNAVDDAIVDGTQTVTITASSGTFQDGVDSLDVTDDDVPTLTLTIVEADISENGGASSATVSRNTDTGSDLTVDLASDDTGEATVPSTVTILAGDDSAAFTVNAVDDAIVDGTQTATITASSGTFQDGVDSLDITDDDVPTLTLTIVEADISENGGASSATVSHNTDTGSDLTVDLASDDTGEATVPSTVTILAGDDSATFTVSAVDDSIVDGTQTVTITASSGTFQDGVDSLDVTDDDVAGITIVPLTGLTTSESGATDSFTVVLDAQPSAEVILALASSDESEGTVTSAQLTFKTDNWDQAQTVTIQGVDDLLADGNIDYLIETAPSQSADADFNDLDPPDVAVTNLDDPTEAPIALDQTVETDEDVSVIIGLSGSDVNGDILSFQITQLPANGVLYQTDDSLTPGAAIEAENTVVTDSQGRVLYTPPADGFGEGLGDFLFSANDGLASSSPAQITVNVNPVNDAPVITEIQGVVSLEDEATDPLLFNVLDPDNEASDAIVTVTLSNPALVGPDGVELILIATVNAAYQLTLTPLPNVFGESEVTIEATDGGETGFWNFVWSVLPVNDPPQIAPVDEQIVEEDSGPAELILEVSDPDNEPGGLELTAQSDNEALIPSGSLELEFVEAQWRLRFVPQADQFGTADLLVEAGDGLMSAQRTIRVHVESVNDAPTFETVEPIESLEDQSIVRALEIGDADDELDSLAVSLSHNRPELFPEGSYEVVLGEAGFEFRAQPALNAFGSATFEVAIDDGTAQTTGVIEVDVVPVNDPPIVQLAAVVEGTEDRTVRVPVDISDVETPLEMLEIGFESSNPGLIEPEDINLILGEEGPSLEMSPRPNAFGESFLRISAGDGETTTTARFTLIIHAAPDGPRISPIADRIVEWNQSFDVDVFLSDDDSDLTDIELEVTVNFPRLLAFELDDVEGGGSVRTIRFVPEVQRKGIVEVVVKATDPEGNESEERFQIAMHDLSKPVPVMSLQAQSKPGEPSEKQLVLAWIGDFVLQAADNPKGPYEAVQELKSPITVELIGDYRFFRVVPKEQLEPK